MEPHAAQRRPSERLARRRRTPSRNAAPRRVPIRFKFMGAMCLPTLALGVIVVYKVAGLAEDTRAVREQTALATSADGPTGLIFGLQNERNWAVVELIGQGGVVTVPVEGYDQTRSDTDRALAGFREDLADGQDEIVEAYQPAVDGLAELDELRASIDAFQGPRTIDNVAFANEVFERYKQMIEPFLEGTSEITEAVSYVGLRQGAVLIDTSVRQIETIANLSRQTIVYGVLSEGGIDQRPEVAELGILRDHFVMYATELEGKTDGPYAGANDPRLFDDFTAAFVGQIDAAIRTGRIDLPAFLETVTVPTEHSYPGYEAEVVEVLRREARELDAAATARQRFYLVVVAVVAVVAVLAMWWVSRSITRSLRSLTGQATDMAHRRLPSAVSSVLRTPLGADIAVPSIEPVEVTSNDEVGDVASALNSVQHAALDLAVGQAALRRNIADSFVNLGRRNQNLLARQLSFITDLEHREVDPDNLGNLFQLDHLATRMRRNAESLLVLGGVPSSRNQGAPLRIVDVIRAALSEVEDYRRVVARVVEPVRLSGSAAADLVHLLAELIDNALMFSPRDRTAEIRGLTHPAGYTVSVIDQGRGMHPEEIAHANRRLAGAEPFTVAPSKYLGHYVTGHLAARHGIQVRLQKAPTGGVAATVHLPRHLLVDLPPLQLPTVSGDGPGHGSGHGSPGGADPGRDPAARPRFDVGAGFAPAPAHRPPGGPNQGPEAGWLAVR